MGKHSSTSCDPKGDRTDLVTFPNNSQTLAAPSFDASTCSPTRNSTFPLFVLDNPALEFCEGGLLLMSHCHEFREALREKPVNR